MAKKRTKGPLLYINQTFTRTPFSPNNQEIYTSKREIEEFVEGEAAVQGKESKELKTGIFREPIPIEIEQTDQKQNQVPDGSLPNEKVVSHLKRVKPFNEMDVKERIDYLLNIPKVLPPIPCVFYTTTENYQGYLAGFVDNEITIQFHNKSTKTIPLDQLKNIIMIGLKK
ncbi:CotO family spore coat protein [Neobacillus sp. OS1-32]|uniref:Spore coat protein CotO n=1 Tax=Neobacillus paridis TaxID=2803862 RepID=A0ABS1TM64_9BACI|nr:MULTISPECIES: CotO family spore coat protein [Neobacillus]MBL4952416.1 hypothetical protein [Neobacillus paridis]WML32053.1 CotO family spore coat protein [Neobacillus sp. OS1-32]